MPKRICVPCICLIRTQEPESFEMRHLGQARKVGMSQCNPFEFNATFFPRLLWEISLQRRSMFLGQQQQQHSSIKGCDQAEMLLLECSALRVKESDAVAHDDDDNTIRYWAHKSAFVSQGQTNQRIKLHCRFVHRFCRVHHLVNI